MKKLILIILLIFTPFFLFAADSTLEKQIIGTWQSVKFTPKEKGEEDPLIWKEYRNDGKVIVIYGNPDGFRLKEIYDYKIIKNKLYDTNPIRNKKDIYNVSIKNGRLKLSLPEFKYWEIYERKEKPSVKLQNMPEIPKNLEESFSALSKLLSAEEIKKIKEGDEVQMNKYHLGLGMWLRNTWGLWRGSELKDYFKKIGINHPDDMSAIILNSYWRHLNNKPINLREQVSFYQEYWKYVTPPENAQSPIDGSKITLIMSRSCYEREKETQQNCTVRLGVSESDGKAWVYQYGKGVYEPSDDEKNDILKHYQKWKTLK